MRTEFLRYTILLITIISYYCQSEQDSNQLLALKKYYGHLDQAFYVSIDDNNKMKQIPQLFQQVSSSTSQKNEKIQFKLIRINNYPRFKMIHSDNPQIGCQSGFGIDLICNSILFTMKLLFIILLVAFTLAGSTCGGNCPVGNCNTCVCGTTRNVLDIATWCVKYDWSQTCCKCIVSHESGGNANALSFGVDTYAVGLWQIDYMFWFACNGGSAPCDPTKNLNCAIVLFKTYGDSWTAWQTHEACGC